MSHDALMLKKMMKVKRLLSIHAIQDLIAI
jgi:hypothetical protein